MTSPSDLITTDQLVKLYNEALIAFKKEITAEAKILMIPLNKLDDYVKMNQSPSVTVLPEYIALGNIKVEDGTSPYIQNLIEDNPLPAMANLRKSVGITYEFDDLQQAQELAQLNILRLLLTMDFECSKCSIIDTQGFGANAKFIRNAAPQSTLITDLNKVEQFVANIQEETSMRIDSLDPVCDWLFEHNAKHKDQNIPYHFIYIANFANTFPEENEHAFSKLLRVIKMKSAAMAGIYFIICNPSKKLIAESEHSQSGTSQFIKLLKQNNHFEMIDPHGIDTSEHSSLSRLCYDIPSYSKDSVSQLIFHCQKHLTQKKLTIVKYEMPESEWYKGDSSKGISVPIGKNKKGEYIHFMLGSPSIVFNALVGGAVGTGKTVLLHAIILALAQRYSPDELAISILDYKEGTEFIQYKNIPHLYALSAGPNVDFGVELMKHMNDLLSKRGLLFKRAGSSSIEEYRKKTGEILPRHIIVIDEFQVLLADERVGGQVQQMVEDLVRRGRSFGFNFIFSSQSLADYSLTQSLSSNIGLRICLRLSTNESSRFLDIANEEPSTFTKPGQALLNIGEGRKEFNELFQVAYYSEDRIMTIIEDLRMKSSQEIIRRKRYIYENDNPYSLLDLSAHFEEGQILLGAKQALDITVCKSPINPNKSPIILCGTIKEKLDNYLEMISNQLKNTSYKLKVFDEGVLDTIDQKQIETQFLKASKEVWVITIPPEVDALALEDIINQVLIPRCELLILRMNECHLEISNAFRDKLIIFFDDSSYLKRGNYLADLHGRSLNQDLIACMQHDHIKYLGPYILP